MKQLARVSLPVFVLLFASTVWAQATPRILMVGDSWPGIMWAQRSMQTALQNAGLGQFEERGSLTAIGGTEASEWAQPTGGNVNLQLLTDELANNPEIDIVHLSIGGNDMLGAGFPNIASPGPVFAAIYEDIEIVIDHILAQRSDIRVLLVEYDYLPGNNPAANALQLQFAAGRLALTLNKERCYYFNGMGLMHATFGFPPNFEASEVPYPGTYPSYDPFPGGDPDFGSSPANFIDSIHLNAAAYVALSGACVDQYYRYWLTGAELPALPILPPFLEEGGTLELTIPGAVNPALPVQWFHNGAPLADDLRIDGANERTLRITGLLEADSGNYTATYDNFAKAAAAYGPVAVLVVGSLPVASLAAVAVMTAMLLAAMVLRQKQKGN